MPDPTDLTPLVTRLDDAPVEGELDGDHYGAFYKVLTPHMRARGGKLGLVWNRVPPGRAACPAHTHRLEDEVFLILSGHGTLRYGAHRRPLQAGDCVSCPAGAGVAHQIVNTHPSEDLIYLAAGNREPDEICTYPDSGKVMVRGLGVGRLERTAYMEGEPERPLVLDEAGSAAP
ncbi:MAG: cupin domain-containing protein [Myxococcales bacterium]|nr:cupin domain-containing protein [Myxococcales bacterium]